MNWGRRAQRIQKTESVAEAASLIRNPFEVQLILRSMTYNREETGPTLRSAEQAWRHRTAHCLEAAFLACAWLEALGHPPIVLSFESIDGLDHVVALFRVQGRWGSIGRSRDEGLHGRRPVFRSIRDLARSYHAPYVDSTGRIETYQWVHLDETLADWRTGRKNVWKAERYLLDLAHRSLRLSEAKYRQYLKDYHERGSLRSGRFWL